MEIWQLWCVFGLLLLILEMFTPALFFLNLAFGAIVTAVFAYYGAGYIAQTVIFAISSILLILFLRPFIMSKVKSNNKETGIQDKYIGKEAKVVQEVNKETGRIAIYGEEWNAKTFNSESIPVGSFVKIIKNDSLIMYVEKI